MKPIIGWREWVALPDFKIANIKAKVDSGAKTSAIHAEHLEWIKRGGKKLLKFRIYSKQRDPKHFIEIVAPVVDERWVKTSVGHKTLRPVVKTLLKMGELSATIELTLVNRDLMGYRMLLGREAFKNLYLLDASRSYVLGKRLVKKRKVLKK